MALSIGTLVGYLELDDTKFDRKADQADRKMRGMELQLKALAEANPTIDVNLRDQASARIAELQAKLAALRAESADGLDIHAKTTRMLALQMQLDETWAKLKVIGKETEADTVRMRLLANAIADVATKAKGLPSGPNGIFGLAALLGPAIVPAGAAAVGVLGGIASAAASAVAGVTVLGMAFKGTKAAAEAFSQYQTAMAKATTPKQRAAAQRALNASAYGKASEPVRQFVKFDMATLHPFGAGLVDSAQAGILPGMTAGLTSLVKDAPQLNAAISGIAGSLGDLFAEAGHAMTSPFWQQFIVWFGRKSADDVSHMGHAVGEVVEAFARMDQRSGGGHLVKDIDGLATKLNHWTQGDGFLHFLDTVHKDEAQVSAFLHVLWQDLEPVLKGIAESGGGELNVLTGALGFISHLPTSWLEEAGKWLPVILLTLKANQLVAGPVADGIAKIAANLATMAEQGMTKTEMFKSSFGSAMRSIAGPAGIGLLIDSMSQADDATSTLESTLGAMAIGFSVGGPAGAAIGGLTELIGNLVAEAFSSTDKINSISLAGAKKQYQDLADTIDSVTLAMTAQTRLQILEDSKKVPDTAPKGSSTSPYSLLSINSQPDGGLTDKEITDIGAGTASKAARAKFNSLLATFKQANKQALAAGDQTDATLTQNDITMLEAFAHSGRDGQIAKARQNAIGIAIDLNKLNKVLGDNHAAQAVYNSDTANTSAGMARILEQFGGLKKFNGTKVKALIDLEGGPSALLGYKQVLDAMKAYEKDHPATVKVGADTSGLWATLNSLPKLHMDLSLGGLVPGHALGTIDSPGGWRKVGENGPEYLFLPKHTRVANSAQTAWMDQRRTPQFRFTRDHARMLAHELVEAQRRSDKWVTY